MMPTLIIISGSPNSVLWRHGASVAGSDRENVAYVSQAPNRENGNISALYGAARGGSVTGVVRGTVLRELWVRARVLSLL